MECIPHPIGFFAFLYKNLNAERVFIVLLQTKLVTYFTKVLKLIFHETSIESLKPQVFSSTGLNI